MSEGIIVRRGGGGIPVGNPVIHVTAPTGSSVTLAKTGSSITIPASQKHVNGADATLDDWYYSIPSPSSSETWTVSAAKTGETTATQTVTVASGSTKWYDVKLSFDVYLVRNGVLQSGVSLHPASGYTLAQNSGYIRAAYDGGSSGVTSGIGPIPNISFPYLVLKASTGSLSDNPFSYFGIQTASTSHISSLTTRAALGAYSGASAKTWTLDVSNVTLNNTYFGICTYDVGGYLNITDIYFSKVAP